MQSVHVTQQAVRKVQALLQAEGDLSLKLRAYVTGGGCQGLQYGFAFESLGEEGDCEIFVSGQTGVEKIRFFLSDLVLTLSNSIVHGVAAVANQGGAMRQDQLGVSVLIDPISLTYLTGSEIDYVVDAQGERFVVRNPNAKTTCGCDRSFTPAD